MFLARQTNKNAYRVRDRYCLGCACFIPGKRKLKFGMLVFKRDRLKSANRLATCTTRYDTGCPEDTGYSEEIMRQRIKDGWQTRAI
jgi:hypothetical protein